ncbi:adenylate kinase [bacterium]|nr:adenylate kinase [bacterium]
MKINSISANFSVKSYGQNKLTPKKVTVPMPCDSVSFTGKNDNPKKVIILLGAPNSGKGTYARQISENLGIPQISTGNILRKEVKDGTDLGLQAKSYMESGGLVPDELIMQIFKKRISEKDCANGFVLDGFPRTLNQARQLDNILSEDKNTVTQIVNLDVEKSILYYRSAARYTCEDCSRTYSIKENYNPETAKCDCGGRLVKRADDTPEVLSKRLENYDKQTKPLIDYYGDRVSNITVQSKDTPAGEIIDTIMDKIG